MGSLPACNQLIVSWEADLPVLRECSGHKGCAQQTLPLYTHLSLAPILFLLLARTGGRLGIAFSGTAELLPISRLAHCCAGESEWSAECRELLRPGPCDVRQAADH